MKSEQKSPVVTRVEWLIENVFDGVAARFARKVGLTSAGVSTMRSKGQRPHPRTLRKIADGTGCSLDWLEEGRGEPFPAGAAAAPEAPVVVVPPAVATGQVIAPYVPRPDQDAANMPRAVEPLTIAGGRLVDADTLADLVRVARRLHGPNLSFETLAEHAVLLYANAYSESNQAVIPGALAAVLGAALEQHQDVNKACAKAAEFYELAVRAKVI